MNKPTVNSNIDGNAFMVIGAVAKVLKKDGQQDRAEEFTEKAFECGSYDELLNLTHEYIEWV